VCIPGPLLSGAFQLYDGGALEYFVHLPNFESCQASEKILLINCKPLRKRQVAIR
jgi:hypothetical protein